MREDVRQTSGQARLFTAILLTWGIAGVAAAAQPGGIDQPLTVRGEAAPALNVPLPEAQGALKEIDVPQKRDRLPDETQVEVKRFVVTRLDPKAKAAGTCQAVIYEDLCGVPVKDPALDKLLEGILKKYENRASVFDLEDVAFQVPRHFRATDLILDTAFIPPRPLPAVWSTSTS